MKSQPEFLTLRSHLEKTIVGQKNLLDRLMIAILTGGHILLESPPGLAKTTAIKALASGVHASFQRIQFTPDLMPADITGSDVFNPKEGDFKFLKGPLFNEIILADEINRAPPKVQSALLEAMEEHQVTISGHSYDLPDLFIVLATQNPLEQSGTYPLPEAQLDRFLMHVIVSYPSEDEEYQILERDRQMHFGSDSSQIDTRISPDIVLQARREVAEIHIEENVKKYAVQLVNATRQLDQWVSEWGSYIQYGASPRATLALVRSACAHAYLQGRDYVIPDDIMETSYDVLRHRIITNYTAKAQQVSADDIVKKLIEIIPLP